MRLLVEFWAYHSEALKGRSGQWTCLLADGMARGWPWPSQPAKRLNVCMMCSALMC